MSDIQCIFQSMSGKGSIFISNYTAAQNLALLQSKGIQAILSAARSGLLQHSRQAVPHYLYLPADDHEDYAIHKYFSQTYEFIEQARKHTNVLVHCMAGISRSVTIVIAYLIKKFKYSLEEVLVMMQRKRNKINPNRGFIQQLKIYAKQEGLKGVFKMTELTQQEKLEEAAQKVISKQRRSQDDAEYILTNPLAKYHQGNADKLKSLERTASTKEDIGDFSKKSDELKQEEAPKSHREEILQLCTKLDSFKPLEIAPLPLRKRFSFDSRHDNPEKKLTQEETIRIEEKITRVREKLQQKGGVARPNQKAQLKVQKGEETAIKQSSLQNLRLFLERKKPVKQPSEYLSLNTMGESNTQSANNPQDLDEIYIHFCPTETGTASNRIAKTKPVY